MKLTKGDHIMFWMLWLSLAGLLVIAKFFPHAFDKPIIPPTKSQPWPWYGITILSIPTFLIWLHFFYTEMKKIIKKHGKNWWKFRIK